MTAGPQVPPLLIFATRGTQFAARPCRDPVGTPRVDGIGHDQGSGTYWSPQFRDHVERACARQRGPGRAVAGGRGAAQDAQTVQPASAARRRERAGSARRRGAGTQLPARLHRRLRPLAWSRARPSSNRTCRARRRTSTGVGKEARDAAKDADQRVRGACRGARVVTGRELCAAGAERRARLSRRGRSRCAAARAFETRQEPRHPVGAEMPGRGCCSPGGRRTTRLRDRDLRDARDLPVGSCLSRPIDVLRVRSRGRRSIAPRARGESPRPAARTGGRRPAGHRRPDRRRQVRHHVPGAGARSRAACTWSPSPISMSRARTTSSAPPAGTPEAFSAASLGDALKTRPRPCHRRCRRADRVPRHRGDRRGDRRPGRRHPPRACARSRTASTSSWSTSRPMRSPGRCWRARRRPRAWSTASPGATSRR